MEALRIDSQRKREDILKEYLATDESVLFSYGVVPLDYRIADYLTPMFYITEKRILFFFDEVLEIYSLENIAIEIIGEKPNFEIRKLIMEMYPSYTFENRNDVEKLKLKEGLTRISITEPKQVPKYFLLRKDSVIQKSYKTWALSQLLDNIKGGQFKNEMLLEMMAGFFSAFNQKTVVNFVFVFTGYVLLKIILGFFLPPLFDTIIDILFAIVLILFGYWMYVSIDKNFKKYFRYYLSSITN